jgi:hypothetical protein
MEGNVERKKDEINDMITERSCRKKKRKVRRGHVTGIREHLIT